VTTAPPEAEPQPSTAPGPAAATVAAPAGLGRFLARGAARRCPRCGRGPLFTRGTRMRERCPDCDLVYLEDRGDPWAFLMIIDRVAFIFPLVMALYFGLHRASLAGFIVFGVALGVAFLATTPNRYGISVALVHWARWRFGGEP
jgi:uncharacterized protein (DUF983 family)